MPTTPSALARLRHELHTPLNHIIGFAEMLLEDTEDAATVRIAPALQLVHDEARQLLRRLDAA
ncbi:MAG: histidine kinase dimerization/phospho-acceptor domain-containing protein, partial [Stellaceae bacterium]